MKNFFSLLLALMFSCTFTVCAFAAEPYAENSNPPTLQDTKRLQRGRQEKV